jgi:hypothetical protein
MRDRKLLLCAVLAAAGGAAACSHNDRALATPSASTAPSGPDMTAQMPPPPLTTLPSQSSSDCPMTVEGAQVTVDRMDGGVAYVFTTQTGDVAQLRDRVRKISDQIEHDQSGMDSSGARTPGVSPSTSGDVAGPSGGYPSGTAQNDRKDQNPTGLPNNNPSGPAGAQGNTNTPNGAGIASSGVGNMHSLSSVPAHAIVIDIDRGARLELRPLRSEDLDALRTHAEHHAAVMASGQCPTDQNAG